MKRFGPVSALIAGAVLVITTLVVASGQPAVERTGILDVLQPGMTVSLKEIGGRFEIGTLEDAQAPLGHEVLEVGSDYIVLGDIAGVTRRHIPVYSLSCITITKTRP